MTRSELGQAGQSRLLYRVTSEEIWVRRLFWCTRVSLAELMSARVESEAMRWSVRLWGNGGFFSFTGLSHPSLLFLIPLSDSVSLSRAAGAGLRAP